MAWRPTRYLIEGELDNRQRGRITGRLRFAGLYRQVMLDLVGDFQGAARGQVIRITGEGNGADPQEATTYMRDFALHQEGKAGDMQFYGSCAYLEWYSDDNGRIVLELPIEQVHVKTLEQLEH